MRRCCFGNANVLVLSQQSADEMREVVDYFRGIYSVINFEQRGVGLSKCGKSGFKIENYISDFRQNSH